MTNRLCTYAPCSKPLVLRAKEKPSQLARRTCCNRSCANRKSRGSVITDLPAEKLCEECDVVMRPAAKETPSSWKDRRFCTRLCTSRHTVRVANRARLGREAARMEDLSARVCIRDGCQQVLVRRNNEKSNRFRDRECCSFTCAQSVRQARTAAAKPVCARPGCTNRTKKPGRKTCSRECQAQVRRTPGSRRSSVRVEPATPQVKMPKRARTPGSRRSSVRVEPAPQVKMPKRARTQRKRPVEPAPPLDLAALRPDPAALIPDPGVLDMDQRRRDALRLLDNDEPAGVIAAKLGVSVAQVNRWDRGDR